MDAYYADFAEHFSLEHDKAVINLKISPSTE